MIDVYANGKLYENDLSRIYDAMKSFNMDIPVDTICVKSGHNYLSEDAFNYSLENHSIHNKIVYVIKHMTDIHFPSKAQETYFKDHVVDYCTSIDEAYHLLT